MSAKASSIDDSRIGDFFPRSQGCKEEAVKFFQCFQANSVMESDSDVLAGERGLKACLNDKKVYEMCMGKKNTIDPKRYRVSWDVPTVISRISSFPVGQVQEEYRKRQKD